MKKSQVTPFGWAIKRRLAELEIDQKTFCEQNNIPQARLSNLINGTRKTKRYRKQVISLLNLHEYDES
ncbi:XRE family transcriptional regulator [Paenibacillus sp. Y412MC10]|uniref:XRE family transcriptional regulator n=1 Tax=Geobacillus sp. (strain Y412MC10) TaxID=481743 RepID=UPI00119E19FA|nr:XRE family transcriptional regulator [Paenibacillus sp. Y412MC10]